MHLPFEVADYVDFYASLDHATNVGQIFRPDGEPLTPNWRHLPIGYHGRAGTVVVSGTQVVRPTRSAQGADEAAPTSARAAARHRGRARLRRRCAVRAGRAGAARPRRPRLRRHRAQRLVGARHPGLGVRAARAVPRQVLRHLDLAVGHAAGGARRRLGATCPARTPSRSPTSARARRRGLDIDVEVVLNGEVVSRPPYRSMYWSPAQMLAHMTVNGASLRTGDLFGSGTISGPEPDQRGSFLELCWGGQEPFGRGGRTFLEDGDEVVLRYSAPGTAAAGSRSARWPAGSSRRPNAGDSGGRASPAGFLSAPSAFSTSLWNRLVQLVEIGRPSDSHFHHSPLGGPISVSPAELRRRAPPRQLMYVTVGGHLADRRAPTWRTEEAAVRRCGDHGAVLVREQQDQAASYAATTG